MKREGGNTSIMKTPANISDLQILLEQQNIKIDDNNGYQLFIKDTAIGYISTSDQWGFIYKNDTNVSLNTKDLLKCIKNNNFKEYIK